jgi:hypothetical protein
MNDKSPRQNLSKKSGKSIKEQRAEKRGKQADTSTTASATRKQTGR